MSADNYFLIRKDGDEYVVSMGFESNEGPPPFSRADKRFPNLERERQYAHGEYSEYGVREDLGAMMSDDVDLEVLVKKMFSACITTYKMEDCPDAERNAMKMARVARDHFAMTAERRKAIIDNMFDTRGIVGQTRIECESSLFEWGAIPPRPEPTIGDRLEREIRPMDCEMAAAKLTELLSPVVAIVRRVAQGSDTMAFCKEAAEALKGLEKLGGGE